MSDAESSWQRVSKGNQHSYDPRLTIYTHGQGYVNAAADRDLLDAPDCVHMLVDPETNRLALKPTDDDSGRSITREGDHGGDIHVKSALHKLGIDVEAIDDTQFFELEYEDGLAVADLSALVADEDASDGGDDDDGSDAEETLHCGEDGCEFTTTSKRGLNIHKARTHDTGEKDADTTPKGSERASRRARDDGDEGDATDTDTDDDSPSLATVRDCSEEVETVQDLAHLLDVSPNKARALARDANVYRDLQDKPPRPGVDR